MSRSDRCEKDISFGLESYYILKMRHVLCSKAEKIQKKRKVFSLTSRHHQAIDSGPRFYVSSERQGWHTELKIWKQSHMDLPIPDSNLQPSSHKANALPTDLPGSLPSTPPLSLSKKWTDAEGKRKICVGLSFFQDSNRCTLSYNYNTSESIRSND